MISVSEGDEAKNVSFLWSVDERGLMGGKLRYMVPKIGTLTDRYVFTRARRVVVCKR